MIDWMSNDSCPENTIYIIPPDLKIWTIYCSEQYYDEKRETTILTLKSRNYFFRERIKK